MFISNCQLDEAQLQALEGLVAQCRATDGGVPALYSHILEQKRATENNILYFQQNNLTGFLSVYFFYPNACEISIMVAPEHRRQGIARQLLQAITPLLITRKIETLIFSTPVAINDSWLSSLGFCYKNSEYHMQRHSYEPILTGKQTLAIRKATEADIPTLCSIDELCFNTEHSTMATRFANLLGDSNYTLLLAFHKGKPVGKAHIRWQADGAILSDIAIIPSCQGKGLGGELLAYCINEALTLGKTQLSLDVETTNQNALNLYIRHDFKLANANDFWSINLDKLRALYESC